MIGDEQQKSVKKSHSYSQNSRTGDVKLVLASVTLHTTEVTLTGSPVVPAPYVTVALGLASRAQGRLYSERQLGVFHQLEQEAQGRLALNDMNR